MSVRCQSKEIKVQSLTLQDTRDFSGYMTKMEFLKIFTLGGESLVINWRLSSSLHHIEKAACAYKSSWDLIFRYVTDTEGESENHLSLGAGTSNLCHYCRQMSLTFCWRMWLMWSSHSWSLALSEWASVTCNHNSKCMWRDGHTNTNKEKEIKSVLGA